MLQVLFANDLIAFARYSAVPYAVKESMQVFLVIGLSTGCSDCAGAISENGYKNSAPVIWAHGLLNMNGVFSAPYRADVVSATVPAA